MLILLHIEPSDRFVLLSAVCQNFTTLRKVNRKKGKVNIASVQYIAQCAEHGYLDFTKFANSKESQFL